ncbi:hypothetical protein GCM10027093_08450 [Paraburkholderia jirisanensis]
MNKKLAGIAALCLTLTFRVAHAADPHASVQEGNIVYTAANGATEVLTETGADSAPIMSPDGKLIAFTRLTRAADEEDFEPPVSDLWVLDIASHKATRLVTGKRQGDEDSKLVLAGIDRPVFSPDGATVYFMTAAWTTSGAIHAVPSVGGRQRFVTDGNSLDVVTRGKYTGALLVRKHRYMDGHGSWDPEVLVSPAGKEIKVVGEGRNALTSVESER